MLINTHLRDFVSSAQELKAVIEYEVVLFFLPGKWVGRLADLCSILNALYASCMWLERRVVRSKTAAPDTHVTS